MKTCGSVEVWLRHFDLGTTFYLRVNRPGPYWVRGWVGPKAGLEKRETLLLPGIEPWLSST
jgi:hypothetical protein